MKIVFTGGGTAGHFYPLVAIAEEVNKIVEEENLLRPELYYFSIEPHDSKALFDNAVVFKRVIAGKARLYFSLLNFLDPFKLVLGACKALFDLYLLYPDVVVSKGGYASIPAVFAARVLKIPVIVHESDTVPGRANLWASRFAERVAVSWPEAYEYFPKDKTAFVGQPVRAQLLQPEKHGAREFLKLKKETPVILVLGGSQGARLLNDAVLHILPQLVKKYQVIHQTGEKNFEEVTTVASVILNNATPEEKDSYKPFGYLTILAMKMAAGAADLVVSRAGSTIFEIAAWGKPSILVPISESNGDHQRKNAFSYARRGAATVIEEKNMTPSVLFSEISKIMERKDLQDSMSRAAREFFKPDAARKIAREAIKIALAHV